MPTVADRLRLHLQLSPSSILNASAASAAALGAPGS